MEDSKLWMSSSDIPECLEESVSSCETDRIKRSDSKVPFCSVDRLSTEQRAAEKKEKYYINAVLNLFSYYRVSEKAQSHHGLRLALNFSSLPMQISRKMSR